MKNILITGGAGFMGSNLALQLIARGFSVTVLDNLLKQIHGTDPMQSVLYQIIAGKVNFIKGDITCRKDVENAVQFQDAIIHLAAETGTGQSMYEIERYNQVNVSGTALLLDVLVNKKNKVQKFILASSRAVYGEGKYINSDGEIVYPGKRSVQKIQKGVFEMTDQFGKGLSPLPTDENSKLQPTSFYGITKLQQEQMVEMVCESIGLNYVILRYQNVYGAGQSLLNPYTGILSIFSTQILNGEPLNIFEDGLMTRDFVYIDDVIEATVASLEKSTVSNETINIGTGVAVNVLSVANLLLSSYDRQIPVNVSGDFRIGDIRHNFADISKAKKLLKFQPKISLEEGIEKFTKWVLEQPALVSTFHQSLKEMRDKGFLKS